MFADRLHAARLLAERLKPYLVTHPLVLGIPRGAVPMAAVIAEALGGELDVVLVRKLGAPFQAELAIGAIDEQGRVTLNEFAGQWSGADEPYLKELSRQELAVLRQRRQRYAAAQIPVAGRTVIVVDDGLATGATMIAALTALRAQQPATLVCAVPVAPLDTLERVGRFADRVVCLDVPLGFQAVGQFYQAFPQVEDEEVIALLQARRTPSKGG